MSLFRKAFFTTRQAVRPGPASITATVRPVMFKPYSPYTYNLIPTPDVAKSIFDKQNGMSIVKNELRPLFQKHELQNKFGAGLVYRRFALNPDERLVEHNSTTTPWQCRDCYLGRKIVPIA